MNKNSVEKIFDFFSKDKKEIKTFYILNHKKHKRKIFFEKNNKIVIDFMKEKFNSPIKKKIYFLIKINILPFFLPRIKLDSSVGQLVYVGGQIKIFNFQNQEVISLPLKKNKKKSFLEGKIIQKNLMKKKICPKIIELNKNIPFSKEILLKGRCFGSENEYFQGFSKLLKYYEIMGIKPKSFLINGSKNKFLTTLIHGDFDLGQFLKDEKGEVFITDWKPLMEGIILEDLIFCFKKNFSKNILRIYTLVKLIYPKEVASNFEEYVYLSSKNLLRKNMLTKMQFKKIIDTIK